MYYYCLIIFQLLFIFCWITYLIYQQKKKENQNQNIDSLKSELLEELAERHSYWRSKGTPEAIKYAEGYERLMCVFTTPEQQEEKK